LPTSGPNTTSLYDIGKGYSVSVLWQGGEVDTIFGFDTEHAALEWIRDKSSAWVNSSKKAIYFRTAVNSSE
jgi:hypothetical protein